MVLRRSERFVCGSAAVCCFIAAFVLMPTGARSQFAPVPANTRMPAPPAAAPIAVIQPARDAFAPRATDDVEPPVAVPPRLTIAQRPIAPPARVTAIATGVHPIALIDIGTETRMVTIGDRINGAPITAIDEAALRFADGTRLELAPEATSR